MNAPQLTKQHIGIDLGTTLSAVAYLDASGRPTTIPNDSGDLLTPSAVLVEDGELIIGKEASKSSTVSPMAYADCFKRAMGQATHSKLVNGVHVPPEVLSALILDNLKKSAETKLGPIESAVITVPAFFDETKRKATVDAAELVGIRVLEIINEPTAAAIAFAFYAADKPTSGQSRRTLVYDLGGGTFDVTVLEIQDGVFRTIATDGDVQLGGIDFDQRIVDYVAERFFETHGLDPRSNPADAAKLWLDARDAKHSLGTRKRSNVVCFHQGLQHRVEITRDIFEQLVEDLVDRTLTTTQLTLSAAGWSWDSIDDLILVGGSSRLPIVIRRLEEISGMNVNRMLSPDEAIAHGAALRAGMLGGHKATSNFALENVNSHSLGIVGMDTKTGMRTVVKLIPRNTKLPTQVAKDFVTARPNQKSVKVAIVEGEGSLPEDCIQLGTCVVRDLPADLPVGTKITVECAYATDGRITVTARLPSTRQAAYVNLERCFGNDVRDLQYWKDQLCEAESVESFAQNEQDQSLINLGSRVLESKKELPAPLLQLAQELSSTSDQIAQIRASASELEPSASNDTVSRIHQESERARHRTELHHLEQQFRFQLIEFGRKCQQLGL